MLQKIYESFHQQHSSNLGDFEFETQGILYLQTFLYISYNSQYLTDNIANYLL
jgi:hypothetical protein